MKKRFWKWNAILSLLAYIWVFVATTALNDGEEPKHLVLFLSIPLTMALSSWIIIIKNKKKLNDAIVGFFYDENEKDPKKMLRNIMRDRTCIVFFYSLIVGLPFRYLSVLNDHLQIWLMLGTFFLGSTYLVYALFDYAKKVGELDEIDSSDK